MSFTQIHPEEEKQLIEHKFTSEEDACQQSLYTFF
jgi:hypothetical protein